LARGFSVPGDHPGQQSNGYRWPYGPVALITPFNFPLEIPVLQVRRDSGRSRLFAAGEAGGVVQPSALMALALPTQAIATSL
jgi:hypothetical protein